MSKFPPSIIASLPLFGPTPLSRHGALRSQQRSIPPLIIDLLIDFGEESFAGEGCYRYFFTKRTWSFLIRRVGSRAKDLERYRSAYAVVSEDGQLVTVGWVH
ncbi:hypothetical protein [Croceibacterium mercuriale]|uniref:hypothetical protein n=1 Tax=Croceibacterium mercuriale TaxID=1572751 RepID=UPI00126A2068|nr:hypothetical protein [Croceibacterium mercuriale]